MTRSGTAKLRVRGIGVDVDIPDIGPDHLTHQERAVREDTIVCMRLRLEPSVARTCPL